MSRMLSFLIGAVSAYQLCDATNYPLKGQNVSLSWTLGPTSSMVVGTTTTTVSVSGNIAVVDGCNVRLDNLQFTGPTSALLYGGIKGTTYGITLSQTTIPSGKSNSSITLPFVTNPGAAVSFFDFNQFRLYDPTSQVLIGTADLPLVAGIPTVPPSNGASATIPVAAATATPVKSSPSASPTANAAEGVWMATGSLVGTFMFMAFM